MRMCPGHPDSSDIAGHEADMKMRVSGIRGGG